MTLRRSRLRPVFERRGIVSLLLVALLLLVVACSGSAGDAAESDFDAQVAAAVEATVAVAVRETVGAQTGVAATVVENAEVAAVAEPSDNSHTIVDYLLANGRHFVGNPDADVVVIEFSDFQ